MKHWHTTALTVGALAFTLATPLSLMAFGGGRGPGGGSPAIGGREAGSGSSGEQATGLQRVRPVRGFGLLQRLIFPCEADCHEEARDCVDEADTAALDCVAAACATEVEAATAACETKDETCRDAVSALRECGTTCLETRATEIETCRSDFGTCADACSADDDE